MRGPYVDWAISGLLAVFMAFIIGVLRWSAYQELGFGPRHGVLSLLGVWLLCFWAVTLARKLLSAKSGGERQ